MHVRRDRAHRLRWWRDRDLVPAVIIVAAYAAFLLYAYPGFTSPDSALQLREARSHQFTDWHPPAMAAIWSVVELVVTGPAGMLVLQSALFVAGAYRLLRRAFRPRPAALLAGALLLLPVELAPMAVIWKDCQMAGCLLLGISGILDERRGWQIAGLVLLTIATALRDNAAVATLPVLVLGLRTMQPRWRHLAIAVGAWALVTGVALGVNKLLTRAESHSWYASVALQDIVGIVRYAPGPDAELEEVLAGTPLVVHDHIATRARRIYTPVSWWPVSNGEDRLFSWPETAEHRAAISRAWRRLVLTHPGAYAHHRYRVFCEVLGLSRRPIFDPVWYFRIDDQRPEPVGPDRTVQATTASALVWLATKTPLFREWIYFVLALLMLPLARRHRDILALLVSGIAYELALLPFAPSPDFRYSHWMITCCLVSLALLIATYVSRVGPQTDPAPRDRLPHHGPA